MIKIIQPKPYEQFGAEELEERHRLLFDIVKNNMESIKLSHN